MAENQTQNPTRETLEKLRSAIIDLERYDEVFKKWVETLDYIDDLLQGNATKVTVDIYITADGEMTIQSIQYPAVTIGETTPISNFSREWLVNTVNKYLSSIIHFLFEDLKNFIEEKEREAKNLLNQLVDKKYDLEKNQ